MKSLQCLVFSASKSFVDYFLFVIEIVVLQALEAIPCVDVLNPINTNNIPPTFIIKQLAIVVEFVCIKHTSNQRTI